MKQFLSNVAAFLIGWGMILAPVFLIVGGFSLSPLGWVIQIIISLVYFYHAADLFRELPDFRLPSTNEIKQITREGLSQHNSNEHIYIRDRYGKPIAYTVNHQTRTMIHDNFGQVKGWYDSVTNTTHNYHGQIVAYGNALTSLI